MSGPDSQTWIRLLTAAQGAQADGESLERELCRGLLSEADGTRVAQAQARLYLAARELQELHAEHDSRKGGA